MCLTYVYRLVLGYTDVDYIFQSVFTFSLKPKPKRTILKQLGETTREYAVYSLKEKGTKKLYYNAVVTLVSLTMCRTISFSGTITLLSSLFGHVRF